jgi:RNA pol II promoter Fmp27 protein domain
MKYRMDFAPLFLSHIYLQQSAEKYHKAAALYLGLKARVERFTFDIHQRQEETLLQRKGLAETKKVLHKPINEAEVDLIDFQLRVAGAEMQDSLETLSSEEDWEQIQSSLENFLQKGATDLDNDESWWDANDFIELGLNIGTNPETRSARVRTAPVLDCPRVNYYRKIRSRKEEEGARDEQPQSPSSDATEHSDEAHFFGETKFGNEDSHECSIGCSECESCSNQLSNLSKSVCVYSPSPSAIGTCQTAYG